MYCICHHVHHEPHLGVLHLPSSVLHTCNHLTPGATLWCTMFHRVYYISHQVYSRDHAVLQEPRLGVLHLPAGVLDLPSSVLHILSCKSGASLGILYLPTGVLHMPSCTSGALLGCTAFAIICHHLTSGATLGCNISHEVYCRGYAVLQELHFGVLHLSSSVL